MVSSTGMNNASITSSSPHSVYNVILMMILLPYEYRNRHPINEEPIWIPPGSVSIITVEQFSLVC